MAPQSLWSHGDVVGGCQLNGLLGRPSGQQSGSECRIAPGQLFEVVQSNGGLGLAGSHLTFLNYLYSG